MAANHLRCYRCGRKSPKARTVYHRGAPLGPTCLETIKERARLRGSGTNARMATDPDTGLSHLVSDVAEKFCPDSKVYCLQCPYFSDKECPLEKGIIRDGFNTNEKDPL